MTTFTWKINSLSVLNSPEPNTATMSNFTILGDENGITGSVTYSVNLLPANVDNFTAYANITPEMAIDWTKEALGQSRVDAMENEVQIIIDQQKIETPQSAPLPWATETHSV